MSKKEEFKDYVDEALESLAKEKNYSVYHFAGEIAELIRLFNRKHKYLGIAIEGYQGTGKTTLALLIAKEFYGTWNLAFQSIRFSLKDFIKESLDLAKQKEIIPLRILDDFAFQGGSKWKREKELVDLLEYMNVIRTLYTCLIFTYVDNSGARFIRDNAKLKIVLNMKDIDNIEVKVYSRRYNVMGVYWKRVMSFTYNPSEIHSDDDFSHYYQRYWSNRLKAVEEKGKLLLEGLDSKRVRVFDFLLGYQLGKHGFPLRDIIPIYRLITEMQLENAAFIGINRKVLSKLREYNILDVSRNAGRETLAFLRSRKQDGDGQDGS